MTPKEELITVYRLLTKWEVRLLLLDKFFMDKDAAEVYNITNRVTIQPLWLHKFGQ